MPHNLEGNLRARGGLTRCTWIIDETKHLRPGRFGRYLLSKFADMQTFAGESMSSEGGMAFGYYKDGAIHPTFLYINMALEEEKVGWGRPLRWLRPSGTSTSNPDEVALGDIYLNLVPH